MPLPTMPTPPALARLHRYSGALLGVFIFVHLANHVLVLFDPAAHIAAMEALRTVYRWPPLEALLLLCVVVQLVTGATRLRTARQVRMTPARLSGMYLLYFLLVHTGAVLAGRGLLELNTNLYFAAAGLHAGPFAWYFAPYYTLAVLAAMVHLVSACFRARKVQVRNTATMLAGGSGTLLGGAIVAAMAGPQVQVPAAYLAVFKALLPS
jgi:succinate dehydrogenase/fumarate reductase cytochrome b subunit